MTLHAAFWKTGEDSEGQWHGLWAGEEVIVAPGSGIVPEAPVGPVEADAVREALVLAGQNLDHVLQRELTALVPSGVRGLTEWAHIMLGLPRHAAIAASDAAERSLAEALTKLSIHWTRTSETWLEVVRELTGDDSGSLQPLPTTLALQLALEELAAHDTLAYVCVIQRLGVAGDVDQVRRLRDLAVALTPDPNVAELLGRWAERTASLDDNYASVKSLRSMGSLRDVNFADLVVAAEAPLAPQRLKRSMDAVRDTADTITLLAFGVDHFFVQGSEAWPRRYIAWAGV